jgi:Spy/CpxP family protein refolding chaperone
MNDRKLTLSACLGAALLLGAWTAAAWAAPAERAAAEPANAEKIDAPGPGGDSEGHMGRRMLADLNLNDEQVAKLKADRLNARKQMIRDVAEIKTLHLDLFDETMNDKPDLDKVERLVKQIGELQTKMLLNRTKGMIFLRSVLTPEQKRKFNALHMRTGFEGVPGAWGEPGEHGERHERRAPGGEDR